MILTHLWPCNKVKVKKNWYELENLEQGYSSAKFEKPRLKSVHKYANITVFVKSGNMSIISIATVQIVKNSGVFMIYLMYLTILQGFNWI